MVYVAKAVVKTKVPSKRGFIALCRRNTCTSGDLLGYCIIAQKPPDACGIMAEGGGIGPRSREGTAMYKAASSAN